MSKIMKRCGAVAAFLAFCAASGLAQASKGDEGQQFQAALRDYQSGELPAAAAILERIAPRMPHSFEVHELLGLVYASSGKNEKAIENLSEAAEARPDSAAAKTNLAAALLRGGRAEEAEGEFKAALGLQPADYSANHDLGELYVQQGRIGDAAPLLRAARRAKPEAYDNSYDLAVADLATGQLQEAKEVTEDLIGRRDSSELHNLLGRIEEKDGKFVAAANELEKAAQMDPSDDNLFDLGSEMLLHRTYEPAIAVFRNGIERYPNSPRLLIGLGMALYARGIYEEAITALLKAADIDPSDPRCYLFLFKAYDRTPKQVEDVVARFKRYAALEPENGLAQYYYATVLWKGHRLDGVQQDEQAVEELLKRSIALDPKIADAHVELGTIYADEHRYAESIPELERALALDANLSDARYRLGTDYVHVGQKEQAQKEFELSEKLRAQHLAEVDKERAEVEQFIYSAKGVPAAKP